MTLQRTDGVMNTDMKKQLISGVASLLLATGTTHADGLLPPMITFFPAQS